MRFAKRRNPACRAAAKPEGIILFQFNSLNWRERVKALKAAKDSERLQQSDAKQVDS